MAVPGLRLGRIAASAHAGSGEKRRIEGCPHAYRRLPVAGARGALVKEPCGSDVTGVKERVAAGQELGDLRSG